MKKRGGGGRGRHNCVISYNASYKKTPDKGGICPLPQASSLMENNTSFFIKMQATEQWQMTCVIHAAREHISSMIPCTNPYE